MPHRAQADTVPRLRRPLFVSVAAIAVLACSQALAPGDLLVGTWSSDNATLTATSTGASLTIPCIAVQFSSIHLDDSLTFRATGVVTRAGGLVLARVGDTFPLAGRLVRNRVVIPYRFPASGQDTLAPGDRGIHVCNA